MKKYFCFSLLSLLVWGSTIYAQETIIPPSPNAAALAMYADYPVSHYTGVPEINIPLYEIKVDGYTLPISLSYHASGIKVAQEASWVGLGWVLNAGGAISRTIRGGDDFSVTYYPNMLKGWYLDSEPLSWKMSELYPGANAYIVGLDPAKYFNGAGVERRVKVDTEPDIFFYNLPGLSGKFIYNKPKTPVLFDRTHNLKIEWIEDPIYNYFFKVTDSEGVVYLFEKPEKTERTYTDENYFWQVSSWVLTKIITPNQQEINFFYAEEYSDSPQKCTMFKDTVIGRYQYGGIECPPPLSRKTYNCSALTFNSMRLSKIEWNNGSIIFDANTREDLKPKYHYEQYASKKLNKLRICDKNGTAIKSFAFDYDYFNNTYTGNDTYLHKRLKLKNVIEIDADENQLNNGHSFYYFEGDMPAKNTNNMDYWGYNNGSNYGENYYAAIITTAHAEAIPGPNIQASIATIDATIALTTNRRLYSGAVKRSNFDYLKIGTLNKIVLPTSDAILFEYQENTYSRNSFDKSIPEEAGTTPNDESKGGGLRITKIISGSKTRNFEYCGGLMLIKPTLSYIKWGGGCWRGNNTRDFYIHLIQSSESTRSLSSLHKGNAVGYREVKESVSDGTKTVTTEYSFFNEEEEPLVEDLPFLSTEINFMNGNIERKVLYDGYTISQITEYEYNENNSVLIYCCFIKEGADADGYIGLEQPYQYQIKAITKKQEYTETYATNGYTWDSKKYSYNESFLPNEIMTYDSNRTRMYQYLKYPTDYTDPISEGMVAKHIIGTPIEQLTLKGSQVIAGQKTQYSLTNGMYLPEKVSSLKLNNPVGTDNYSSFYKQDYQFDLYNPKGKVLQLHGKDNVPITYLWGYNHQHPIAEIKNATYEQVKTVLSETLINRVAEATVPAEADRTAIDNLRSNLPQAQITTYTYQPLVGMTSATDPRGVKTTYGYDTFGRLNTAKDREGNVLHKYLYHYKE